MSGFTRPSDDELIEIIEAVVLPSTTGYTVRQLFYHLVSHKVLVPNVNPNYKWLIGRLTKLRKSQEIPWDTFVDRERDSTGETADEPEDPVEEAERVAGYITGSRADYLHRWTRQPILVRVAIEKKGLIGLFDQVCSPREVRLYPFKGSPSLTMLYELGTEMEEDMETLGCSEGVILYYGDHDPTGMNIPIAALNTLLYEMGFPGSITLERMGLNQDQARDLDLPPDPANAKPKDSRLSGYQRKYGNDAWELDAVPPKLLQEWLKRDIASYFDRAVRDGVQREDEARNRMYKARVIEAAREVLAEYDAEQEA